MVIRSASAEAVAVASPPVAVTTTTTRRRPRKAPPRPSCRLSLVDAVVAGLAAAAAKKHKWEEGDTKGDPAASGEDAKEEGSVTSDARSGSPQPESPPTLSPAPPEEEECPQTSPLAAAPSTPDAPPDGTLREGDDVAPVDTRAPAESKDVELANRDEDDVPLKIAEPAKESEDDMLRHVSVKTEEPVDELLADGEGPQEGTADAPLDFSIKKSASPSGMDSEDDDVPPSSPTCQNGGVDCPLDLSLSKRKARHSTPEHRPAKVGRLEQGTLPGTSSPWSGFSGGRTPSAMPQASRVRPPAGNQPPWNGKIKRERSTSEGHHSSATISAVGLKTPHIAVPEKMPAKADAFRAANRQNPWQSQWISRSGEQTKDVFTCVWCKESFQSLADMTLHMKQSPRCGMAGMHAASAVPPPPVGGSSGCNRTATTPPPKLAATPPGGGSSGSTGATTKDGVPLPRKLVRGQDVWLGKGAEQTRQILKCMWCGQSFKSLADMTTHMRVTQHYTNIISQEQIISWRTPEDKVANQSQVNAVLTCKVCDQAFGSLKELSYHMVKNSHYKEHILRSITEGGGRRRQTRERRKKSLPVRKLLELERMEMTTRVGSGPQASPSPAAEIDGKIACEECAEKVDAKDFVQHIKSCSRSQQLLKTALQARLEPNGPVESRGDEDGTPEPRPRSAQSTGEPDRAPSVDSNAETSQLVSGSGGTSSTSVLNAIEKLIEKSFDNKGKRGGPSSAGILQRLGIDEEVYPPWHPAGSPRYSGGPTKSPLPRLTPSGLTSPCPSLPDDHHQAPILQPASQCSTPSRYHAVSPDRHSGVSSPRHRDASDKDSEPPLLDPERISQPRSPSESSSTRASTPGGDDLIIADGDVRTSSRRSSERGLDTDDVTSSSSCEAPVLVPTERRRSSPSPRPIVPPVHKRSSVSPRPQSLNRTQLKKERNNNRQSDDATSDHPLKGLQKLLDKTDAHLSRSSVPQASAGGSILAFSWACNDAANASDSLMKCAFCDTHFVSKGAYRHHLSKMHFIKDGGPLGGEGSPPWKGSQNKDSTANGSEGANQPQSSTNNSGASGGIDSINSPSASPAAVDESPHSKFLKYTELAKQLSSKYV